MKLSMHTLYPFSKVTEKRVQLHVLGEGVLTNMRTQVNSTRLKK